MDVGNIVNIVNFLIIGSVGNVGNICNNSNICDIAIIGDIVNTRYIVYLRKVPEGCFEERKKLKGFQRVFF